MSDVTDLDRRLAEQFCGVACPGDLEDELAQAFANSRLAAEARGAERERARVVEWLRESIAYHRKHDDGLSGFDGIAQGQTEAMEAFLEGDHLPARHADQGEG